MSSFAAWIVMPFAAAVVAAVCFSSPGQQALEIAWLYLTVGAVTLGAAALLILARALLVLVPQSMMEFWSRWAHERARTEVSNQKEWLPIRQGEAKDKRAIEILCGNIWHGIELLPCTPSEIEYLLLESPNESGRREIIGCLGYATRTREPPRTPLIYVPIIAVQERFQGMELDDILLEKFLSYKVLGQNVALVGHFDDLMKREGITCQKNSFEVAVSTTLYEDMTRTGRK